MNRIVYKTPEGVLAVVIPTQEALDTLGLQGVADKDVPAGLEYTFVNDTDIPSDRTFRNAWDKVNGNVVVDMPKARDIHMDKIRVARNQRLVELDLEYLLADEAQNAQLKASIAAEKRRMRDLPQTFDLTVAQTPEELKALWPEGLPTLEEV